MGVAQDRNGPGTITGAQAFLCAAAARATAVPSPLEINPGSVPWGAIRASAARQPTLTKTRENISVGHRDVLDDRASQPAGNHYGDCNPQGNCI